MGAYLAVQQGSKFPPQFIHLVYRPAQSDVSGNTTKIVLIGKGLTFDSGGYNLKVLCRFKSVYLFDVALNTGRCCKSDRIDEI
jgi:leucyl aminopeptidase